MDLKKIEWETAVTVVGAAAGMLTVVGGIFVWSGVYNIAASTDHLSVTTWLLQKLREQSIATQSSGIKAPRLDDDGMIRLGASHYEAGCVPCHNRPGQEINPIVSGMLPSPPGLVDAVERRKPEAVFWIVKHGLKYTGMPAWPSAVRDDEVWALTAFLSQLPEQHEKYLDLAGIDRLPAPVDSRGLASLGAFTQCARCHESEGVGTNGDRVPRLAGLPFVYLLRSLGEYRERIRTSGVMEPVADLLSDDEMQELAAYYSRLAPAADKARHAPGRRQIERGRAIAVRGDAENDIPACLTCHSGAQSPQFAPLPGQHADYIAEQLRVWQRGGRARTPYGRIMAPIAQRLSEQQITDVSAYLASLPPVRTGSGPVAEARP